MALKYGGVNLCVIDNFQKLQIGLWLAKHIPPSEIYEFADRSTWPGKNQTGASWGAWLQQRPVEVGRLFWPTGASRWAVGHFLATGKMLEQIRDKAYGKAQLPAGEARQPPVALDLVMSSSKRRGKRIVAKMYMLPPRPLVKMAGDPSLGLHLLTLVDQRYFWWHRHTGDLDITEQMLWEDLISELFTSAGVSDYGVMLPHADYLYPFNKRPLMKAKYETLPLLLDTAAYCCGCRVINNLSGKAETVSLEDDAAATEGAVKRRDANWRRAGFEILAGGRFAFQNGKEKRDLGAVFPEKVVMTMPIWNRTSETTPYEPTFSTYVKEVRLNDVEGYADYGYHTGVKLYHNTLRAKTLQGGEPENGPEIDALAARLAKDYYGYIKESFFDRSYAGIVDWRPDGLHDVSWTYRVGQVQTRVQRLPWNWEPEELLHGDWTEQDIKKVVCVRRGSQVVTEEWTFSEDGRFLSSRQV